MASAVLALKTRAAVTALLKPPQAAALAVRHASKKTGGSSKNLGGKSPGKRFGLKKMEGHYVHAGNILGTQRNFRWHPGAHMEKLRPQQSEATCPGQTAVAVLGLESSVLAPEPILPVRE